MSPRKPTKTNNHIAVVLSRELIDKLDEKAAELSAAQLGAHITRSDVVRMAIHKFLED